MSRFKVGEKVFVERGKSYASFKLANRICTIKNVGDINKGLNKRSYSLVEEAELGDSVYGVWENELKKTSILNKIVQFIKTKTLWQDLK